MYTNLDGWQYSKEFSVEVHKARGSTRYLLNALILHSKVSDDGERLECAMGPRELERCSGLCLNTFLDTVRLLKREYGLTVVSNADHNTVYTFGRRR